MRETFTHEFPGCIVEYEVEEWDCACPKTWPIIIASTTYSKSNPDAWPKRESWFVRNCKLCGTMPRPQGN